jgi:hypothetical protein
VNSSPFGHPPPASTVADRLDVAREIAAQVASVEPDSIEFARRYVVSVVSGIAQAARLPAALACALAVIEAVLGLLILYGLSQFLGWLSWPVWIVGVLFAVLTALLGTSAYVFVLVARLPTTVSAIATSLKDRIVALKPHVVDAASARGWVGRARSIMFVGRALWQAKKLNEDDGQRLRGLEVAVWVASPVFWTAQAALLVASVALPVLSAIALLALWMTMG